MILFIAEKPDLGKAIAAAIPGPDNYDKDAQVIRKKFQGDDCVIIWCYGHLLELYDPEDYDKALAEWKMESLPFFFPDWKHKIKGCNPDGKVSEATKKRGEKAVKMAESNAKRVSDIGALLKKANTVAVCGDVDDEGQLLIDELLRYFNYTGPAVRLDTSDTSQASLAKALKCMDDNRNHVQDGLSALGRQVSDKAFGFNLTRYYSLINHTVTPVGRVKMPTLGLVVSRDEKIEGHVKEKYYTLDVDIAVDGKQIKGKFVPNKEDTHLADNHISDKAYIESIKKAIDGKQLQCTVTTAKQKESPPLPFNLNKLYAYCGNKYGLQPEKVLAITQALREKHKAITYNRTNCQYLSENTFAEAPRTLPFVAENLGLAANKFDTSIKSRCFDNEKITEHTAIIPTATKQNISAFSDDEKKVYTAIAEYYLAQFMPPAEKQNTKLVAPGPNGGAITAVSTVITKQGYRALLGHQDLTRTEEDGPAEEDKESPLSQIAPGQYKGAVTGSEIKEQETKPLPHYTATTLISDMTCISKYCTNEKVKELLLQKDQGKGPDEKGSIGTPATRAAIVSELVACRYLAPTTIRGKTYLVSTPLGREFYHSLPSSIVGADVSAKWWWIQDQIKHGRYTPDQMGQDVMKTVTKIVQSGEGKMQNADTYASGAVSTDPIAKCPKCGGNIMDCGKNFRCNNRDCGFFIWKDDKFFASLGKKLSVKAVQIMLRDHRIAVKNCTSKKTGKKFDAVILCDFTGDRPAYTFASDEQLESVGACPKCGGSVVEKAKGFFCTNPDCKFALWKSGGLLDAIGKTLTVTNAKELLSNKKTKMVKCKSKKTGKTFSTTLLADFSGDRVEYKLDF